MRTCVLAEGKTFVQRLACLGAAVLALAAARPTSAEAHQPAASRPFQEGISFATWWSGQYATPEADYSLSLLASTGAEWVALIVTGYQETPWSTTIDYTSTRTPTDDELAQVIRQAHSLGLRVMLKPHLDLEDEATTGWWRGHIGTYFTTEAQWAAWFASYRAFITHYAQLAQQAGADQFVVGTELLGTTHRADDWRRVVADVRAVYKGPIVYASLHSGEETSITWWDAVDYIGVDAYYPLNDNPDENPTEEELEAAWAGPKATLSALSARYGKPVIFTEIGYRSTAGCTAFPWDSWRSGRINWVEQAAAYEAAFRQFYNEPWMAGMYWWFWPADPWASGPCDTGYSPRQKPAEDILRAWYGGVPRPVDPVLFPAYDQALTVCQDGLASGWQNWSWGATLNLGASVQGGDAPLVAAQLEPWGGISFRRTTPFSTGEYRWLEMDVRGSSEGEPQLRVYLETADGVRLVAAPVNDCRHIAGGHVEAEVWKRVRIPLQDLNPNGLPVVRLTIQNASGAPSPLFWLDNLRLVAAREPAHRVFLPLTVRGGQ